ncbi:MAG: Spy/CpxP family protein refolding chaperone [Deltaproteobacteria bacterium]|nr:Spy/CpxP family protein refolding chaperone [Deltaproteobacteria bacterium]
MKSITFHAVTGCVCLTIGLFSACGPHGRGLSEDMQTEQVDRFINNHLDKVFKEINASDSQREQITAVKDKLLVQLRAMKGSHKADLETVFEEMKKDKPDAQKLHALLDTQIEQKKEFAHQAIDALIEVHAVLSPEQRTVVQDKIKQHHEMRRERFKMFHKHFGGHK